jgi:hypothetical protein
MKSMSISDHGSSLVELRVQVQQRLAQRAQPGDPHLRRREGVHPDDHPTHATSSHITAALTRVARAGADREHAVAAHQHRRRAAAGERLDDADADLLAADPRERADRDVAAELVGHRRQHAGDRQPCAAHAVA